MKVLDSVEPLPNYCLRLTFDGGYPPVIKVNPWQLGEKFVPLRDEQEFQKAYVSRNGVQWPCGARLSAATIRQMARGLHHVVAVKALSDFRLRVKFEDGLEAVLGMKHNLSGQVFLPLKEESFFRKVFVQHGAVTWPNDVDLDPDVMYWDALVATPVRKKIQGQ